MAALTEPNNLGDLLKYEEDNRFSRDIVTVASGRSLKIGEVVSIKTADGKAYALAPAAADGTEVAVGVLLQDANATSSDLEAVMAARDSIVYSGAIVWPVGITTNQKATATAQLKALGVLIREGA
ncbi:MAG: head decoration protein [Magnetococcales bacterium]|nr:head decoration protein [Magnetococcales bacterium]